MSKQEEKIAIHCPTEELWEKVQEKVTGKESYVGWMESANCIHPLSDTIAFESQEFYEEKGFTIIPAEEWLGSNVITIGSVWEWRDESQGDPTKDFCTVTGFDVSNDPKFIWNDGDKSSWLRASFLKDLKLIESEDSMEEEISKIALDHLKKESYSVPLRVDDKVRDKKGDIGIVKELIGLTNIPFYHVLYEGAKGLVSRWSCDITLIPTEKDIVVGSVWEAVKTIGNIQEGEVQTVKELEESFIRSLEGEVVMKNSLLTSYKLIHRGDVVGCEESDHAKDALVYIGQGEWQKIDLKKQTNKKGKKMNKRYLVVKEGMTVMDRDCENIGEVLFIDELTDTVLYRDFANCEPTTQHISKLCRPLSMPKPKPVKKKATKRGKK